jgi:YVTN family beta-propeller protein
MRAHQLTLALALACTALMALPDLAEAGRRRRGGSHEPAGSQSYASPQSNPIVACANKGMVFVASTTSNRVDVIETTNHTHAGSVTVGMEPVGLAAKPDGLGGCGNELWVANHVSDSVSVIDIDSTSASYLQVVETIQDIDPTTRATLFDEPVGIAFAEDGSKAYVTLSSRDDVAVIDTSTYQVTNRLHVTAQDPRAIAVRGGRLYVASFESNNATEVSVCSTLIVLGGGPGMQCSVGLSGLATFLNDPNIAGAPLNIVVDPQVASTNDRDLFVYRTSDDQLLEAVSGVGTLLYGLAVDGSGNVLVTQTEARNQVNGDVGLNLVDLDNRMFLNQVARVDCGGGDGDPCGAPTRFELEVAPPAFPASADALATPFGAAFVDDDSVLVATAAGTSRVFTLNPVSGAVIDRQDVGAIPYGVAVISSGGAGNAYVLNTLDNTVSVVPVAAGGALAAPTATIPVGDDPTPEAVRLGRIAFNNAFASDSGTFSCASCHPFAHTDQLLWRIGGSCTYGDCTGDDEIRSTMPIRGLRDTVPLHWDGDPGDPFGGPSGKVGNGGSSPANCNMADPHTCFVNLVEGSLSGVMCDQTGSCPAGGNQLSLQEQDDLATFLEANFYPPARSRTPDDDVSADAEQGFRDFFMDQGTQVGGSPSTCADSDAGCHELPLGTATNSETLNGFEAPTMRGMTDRYLQFSLGITFPEEIQDLANNGIDGSLFGFPQFSFIGLDNIPDVPSWDPAAGYDELTVFGTAFIAFNAVYNVFPHDIFQMAEEASTGHSGALGRQVTLNTATTASCPACEVESILDELEAADARGVVNLRGSGLSSGANVLVSYDAGTGVYRVGGIVKNRAAVISDAQSGTLLATLTADLRSSISATTPQPLVAPQDAQCGTGNGATGDPALASGTSFTVEARHVDADDAVFVDGQLVSGATITLQGGSPSCNEILDQVITVDIGGGWANGMHLLQIQSRTPAGIGGLLSPEMPFCIGNANQCNP